VDTVNIVIEDLVEFLQERGFSCQANRKSEIVIRKPGYSAILYLFRNKVHCGLEMRIRGMSTLSQVDIPLADPVYREKILEWISSKCNGGNNGRETDHPKGIQT